MKKCIFFNFLIGISLLAGCRMDVDSNSGSVSTKQNKSDSIRALLSETPVVLADGVTYNDLGITIENRTEMLLDSLNEKTGKYVYPVEDMIAADDFLKIIEDKKANLNIPNLEEPTEADLEAIQKKFPNLSNEQIIENIDAIAEIYEDEFSALILDSVIAKSIAEGTDEPYPTADGSARGLWSTGKKIWEKITGKAKKAGDKVKEGVSNVVDKVKSIKIADKFKALEFNGDCITVYEVAAALKHPFSAVKLKKVIDKSYDLTEEYMGGEPDTMNTKTDAFRHAIFSIALAKEAWGTKGMKLKWAKDFSEAHEKGYKYIKYDAEMDFHNNKVGLRYYDRNTKRRYQNLIIAKVEKSPDEPSYGECCNYLKQNAENAVFVDERLPFAEFEEKLRKISADVLVWITFNEKDNKAGV
ncbi:MAG: hypothetical protein J6X67_08375 [Treponema sp.]|nr:hypothetical protein [Treponema sp.]